MNFDLLVEQALKADPDYTLPDDFASRVIKKTEPAFLYPFIVASFTLVGLALLFFTFFGIQFITELGYVGHWAHQLATTITHIAQTLPLYLILTASSIVIIFTLLECFVLIKTRKHKTKYM